MTDPSNLTPEQIIQAIDDARAAIQRCEDLLASAVKENAPDSVRLMAEAAPFRIEARQKELRQLEDELAKRQRS